MTYYDRVDLRRLEWIIENASNIDLGKSYVKGQLIGGDAQLDILRKYQKRAIMFEGLIPVSYYQHDGDGRRFSHEISLTNLSRKIRHTIAEGMIDIDMKNAHPCILLWLCKKHGIECSFIEKYVNNRDSMLKELMDSRQLSRDGAKKMLLKAINRDDGHYQQTELDPEWLYDYHQQCKKIAEQLCKNYPEYLVQADKSKKRKDQTLWNMKGSAINRLLCHYENELLKSIEQVVPKHNGQIMNLAYDGGMINDNLSKEELQDLFNDIEKEVCTKYEELQFKMDEKLMNEGFTVPDNYKTKKELKIEKLQEKERKQLKRQIQNEINEEDEEEEYQEWKLEFEKEHAKIMDPASIIYTNSLGEYEFLDRYQLIDKYSHKENCVFIKRWWFDPSMRVYSRADIFAPTQKCPSNVYVYNLWKPYPLEGREVEWNESLQEEMEFILHHIKILCDHNEEVFEYVLNWVSQFLQYPHIKTTLIAMSSMEGAGKDSFLHLIKKMIGKGQVYETTRPDDIFGRFNSVLANCRLVVLNEMNASDLQKYDKDMKMLITEDTIDIEPKGGKIYTMSSFHRLMLFTNKTDHPIQTSKGDRRKLITRSSDEMIGNRVHFDRLYGILENEDVLIGLFKFFMSRDITEFNLTRGREIPKTEYQETIKENYTNPVEDWIKYLLGHIDPDSGFEQKETLVFNTLEQVASFHNYCSLAKIKLELSNVQLGVRITNLKIDGISSKKTKSNYLRIFNLQEIYNYYNKYVFNSSKESSSKKEE